jgi:diguanylate cyclase (GGDEF)-like protein
VPYFLDNFNSGHLVVSAKRQISFSNQYISKRLKMDKKELSGNSLSHIFTKASNIFIDSYVYPLLLNELVAEEIQLTMVTSSGERMPVVASIKLDEKQITYWSFFDCVNRDKLYQELIETKELLEKQSLELIEMATVDPLTGLLNRRSLDDRAGMVLSQAQRNNSSVAVVVIDIDHFKNVNDTYGHAFGDAVLQSLGKTLIEGRREHDIVARFGGEEFVLVLPNVDEKDALNISEKIRTDISKNTINDINVTVSIGVSLNNANKNEFDVLFKDADSALYKAKNMGRNQIVLF